jgi:pyruvate dehydrogenase E1 component alpha subunit
MAIAREAGPVGSLHEVREAGLDREDLLGIYRNMLVTRGVEERGHILYRQGKIPGSFYTGRGNEAASVGVATAMGPDDVGTPLHRDMGVHISRGVEPWRIFAQYMGRQDGPTHGRDGNVHMADSQLGLIAMVSHLPAMLPVATGCALTFRIRDESRVAVGWFGEGASARGDAQASDRLRLRQQPVRVLDAVPSRVRDGARRRPRRGVRLRGRGGRRDRRPRRLPRGEARHR